MCFLESVIMEKYRQENQMNTDFMFRVENYGKWYNTPAHAHEQQTHREGLFCLCIEDFQDISSQPCMLDA